MIYINSNSAVVDFPQTSSLTADHIRFINQVTKYSFEVEVTDTNSKKGVYSFDIQSVIKYFEVGQYTYLIYSGEQIIDRGLLQFGEFNEKYVDQYSHSTDIIQYNADVEYTPIPKPTMNITENGSYDVADVQQVDVDVQDSDVRELIRQMQEIIDEQKQKIVEDNLKIEELHSQIEDDDKKIIELQDQISDLEESIRMYNLKIDELQSQISDLEESIREKVAQISELEDLIQVYVRKIDDQQSQISDLEESIREKVAQINELEYNINELQSKLDTITSTEFTENGVYEVDEFTAGWNKVTVDVRNVTTLELTQEEYDSLTEYDPYIIYLITE